MAAMCGAIGLPHDDVRVQLWLSVVAPRDVADEREELDLFLDRDRLVFA